MAFCRRQQHGAERAAQQRDAINGIVARQLLAEQEAGDQDAQLIADGAGHADRPVGRAGLRGVFQRNRGADGRGGQRHGVQQRECGKQRQIPAAADMRGEGAQRRQQKSDDDGGVFVRAAVRNHAPERLREDGNKRRNGGDDADLAVVKTDHAHVARGEHGESAGNKIHAEIQIQRKQTKAMGHGHSSTWANRC